MKPSCKSEKLKKMGKLIAVFPYSSVYFLHNFVAADWKSGEILILLCIGFPVFNYQSVQC